jgi:hypothetical protein
MWCPNNLRRIPGIFQKILDYVLASLRDKSIRFET